MFKKLFSWAFQSEDTEQVRPYPATTASFQVSLNNEIVGFLVSESGGWKFEYTDQFVKQSKYSPLVDFPDKFKAYQSENLWPFFLSRIPGLRQPAIQKILKDNNLNEQDTVSLLKRFGRQSIQNPYVLRAVD